MDSSLSDIETDALEEHVEISGVSEKDSFPEWLHVEHPMLEGKKDYSSVVEPRLALGNKRTYFDCASKEYSDQNPYRPEHGSDMADDGVYKYEFLYETYVKNDRLGYLPNGWTQMKNDCGRVYYSDSNTRTTTFEGKALA
ncbi:hypothetical protein GGF40_001530 [Coemansia sp. RSA 1286]|nr:hypothetical protein GGF40_001530 [Coemansia sp. RSA 1286]